MAPSEAAEMEEFRALSARVAAQEATPDELERWRTLRAQLARPGPTPRRTPPATPRAHARVPRKVRVLFQPLKSMQVTFTEEVSAGGLRLNVRELLEVGAELLLRIELDGPGAPDAVTSIGRVAWCQREGGHYVAGVELIDLAPTERERLEAHAHSTTGPAVAAPSMPPPLPPPPADWSNEPDTDPGA